MSSRLSRIPAVRRHLAVAVVTGLVVVALVIAQAILLAGLISGAGAGLLLGLFLVVAARVIAVYAREVLSLRSAAVAKTRLRDQLLDHVGRAGPLGLSQRRPGDLVTLATRGLDALDGYFARYLPQLVLAVLVPLGVLGVLVVTDGWSAFVVGATLPLVPVFMVLIGLRTRAQSRRQWRLTARLGGHFLDVVEGLPTLAVFRRAKAQAAVIREIGDDHRRLTMSTLRTAFLSALALELLASLSTALVAVEVGLRLLVGGIGYEAALVVLLLTPEAFIALREVGARFHASAEGTAAAEQLFELVDASPSDDGTPKETGERKESMEFGARPAGPPRIEYDDVSLRYPGRQESALDGVSMVFEPGGRYTLVGPSGAGKSSMMALLLGFVSPTGGRILVDGRDSRTVEPGQWRQLVSWVPQRAHVFARTVRENIALGDPDARIDDVRQAAELAGAHAFIRDLPDGYHTLLGERGLRLSAGQRQRLALARAFHRPAPVVVLDEPTAHLDVDNAQAMRAAVNRLSADRTVLVISHERFWTRGDDTTVVRLDAGRIVAPPVPELLSDSAVGLVG